MFHPLHEARPHLRGRLQALRGQAGRAQKGLQVRPQGRVVARLAALRVPGNRYGIGRNGRKSREQEREY